MSLVMPAKVHVGPIKLQNYSLLACQNELLLITQLISHYLLKSKNHVKPRTLMRVTSRTLMR